MSALLRLASSVAISVGGLVLMACSEGASDLPDYDLEPTTTPQHWIQQNSTSEDPDGRGQQPLIETTGADVIRILHNSSVPHEGHSVSSVEYQMFLADVVVHAELILDQGQRLTFRAIEYLKGTGTGEFEVIAGTLVRDKQWDNRPAILLVWDGAEFAEHGNLEPSTKSRFTTGNVILRYKGSVAEGISFNQNNPAWFPQSTVPVGQARAGMEPSFFVVESSGASSPTRSTGNAQSTMTLSRMKQVLAWQDGAGRAEEYSSCVLGRLAHEKYYSDWEAYHGRTFTRETNESTMSSSSAAGYEIYALEGPFERLYIRTQLTGDDTDLFETRIADDDASSRTGYDIQLVTARPLAKGNYRFKEQTQLVDYQACDYWPPYHIFMWSVEVTAPTGTLHESFFDPVDLTGGGVGATGSSGVIDPDEFTVGSDDVEIDGLEWLSGSVVLELDDYVSLSGQTLDFIELDGSIDTSLDIANATVNQTAATWTWSVASQPWQDGDLLMLRVRDSSATPPPR